MAKKIKTPLATKRKTILANKKKPRKQMKYPTANTRRAVSRRQSQSSGGLPTRVVPQWDLFGEIGDAIKKATGGG